jgi:UDP-2,3-diacylglucosamine hydrolase
LIFFISDLHLSPRSPGATRLFLDFLVDRARQAESLFILGDLFEAWVGDDDSDHPDNATIIAALRDATESGLPISLIRGNRDFLLGEGFARETGIHLLDDPYILSTATWQFVLSHGDALCLDDTDYMAFRRQVRDPAWQSAFLARPLIERRQLAQHMDLNPTATDDFLRQHGYATFIHGHTHQPATHDHLIDGIHVERWVLSDWHDDRGEYLAWDGEQLIRHSLS